MVTSLYYFEVKIINQFFIGTEKHSSHILSRPPPPDHDVRPVNYLRIVSVQ